MSNKERLVDEYFKLLDSHLQNLVMERETNMLEIGDIAKNLGVSPKHLIKVVKEIKGNHPCSFYVNKILEVSKELLNNSELTISEVAFRLTYDPSNFTKFFKKYEGVTPSEYRKLK